MTDFLDLRYAIEMQYLATDPDLLDANMYPFFSSFYDGSKPLELLDAE